MSCLLRFFTSLNQKIKFTKLKLVASSNPASLQMSRLPFIAIYNLINSFLSLFQLHNTLLKTVNSNQHMLLTLCFAITSPRVMSSSITSSTFQVAAHTAYQMIHCSITWIGMFTASDNNYLAACYQLLIPQPHILGCFVATVTQTSHFWYLAYVLASIG